MTDPFQYQNRLDLSETYAGTPRIYGGDGPNVKYYDFDQVAEPLPTDPTINTGMWVSGTEPFAEDQFWERGQFGWDRKLHEKSSSVNGGIEWEGYYVPTGTGLHSFTVGTTGCWTFDFQKIDYTNAFQPNTDWDTAPDSTSYYEIVPEITVDGDGLSAEVKALMDDNNFITRVDVVNKRTG